MSLTFQTSAIPSTAPMWGTTAFRPAKGVYSGFGQQMVAKGIFTQEENNSVLRMLDAIPEQDTFILSALRTSSVRYFDDELTIYGLRSACYGHPIYDLGGTSLGIWTPGILGDDDGCKWSNGMDCATSLRFWDAFIVKYFDCQSEEDAAAMAKRVNFAGFLTHYIVPIFFHMGGEGYGQTGPGFLPRRLLPPHRRMDSRHGRDAGSAFCKPEP